MVIVEKSEGKLRICLDPRQLNAAIKRHHYPIPTTEDILDKLENAKLFSKLDCASGYWQIKVDRESSNKDRYWVFPAIEDRHKLQQSSIMFNIFPQIDVNMSMSSNRLIVMELLNSDIILKKAELF